MSFLPDCISGIFSSLCRRGTETFFKGVIEMLRRGIAEFRGDLGSRLLCILKVLTSQEQALFGEIAEDGSPEQLFEPAFQFVFVKTHGPGDLGEVGWRIEPLVDQFADGVELFFVAGVFDELRFLLHGLVAGFGAEDEELDAFGKKEQLLKIPLVRVLDDLADHLLNGGVDGAPLARKDRAPTLYDGICESLQGVARVAGELQEGLAGELDAKGLELEGVRIDSHVELAGIENIMMPAYEVEILVQLLVVKAIIAAKAEVQADDIVAMVAGAKTTRLVEPGDGMAKLNTIDLPEEGIAGAGFGDELLSVLHAAKIRKPAAMGAGRGASCRRLPPQRVSARRAPL